MRSKSAFDRVVKFLIIFTAVYTLVAFETRYSYGTGATAALALWFSALIYLVVSVIMRRSRR